MNTLKSGIIILLLLATVTLSAQSEHIITVETRIDSATVYLSGVELVFTKDLVLKKGINRITFSGLAASLQPQSTRVSVNGNVQIISVSTEINFLSEEKLNPRIARLRDSVNAIRASIIQINDQVDAYQTEKTMLSQNQTISTTYTLADLQKTATFHREQTLRINRTIADLHKQKAEQQKQLGTMEKQLAELNGKNNPERKEVIVVVSSATDQTAETQLRYLCTEGGWSPRYNIVARDVKSPVELAYNANIYNNTGLNWNKVRLTLSTADPSRSVSKPELNPWELDRSSSLEEGYYDMKSIGSFRGQVYLADTVMAKKNETIIEVGELNTEFVIERAHDILSDSKPYLVEIAKHRLEATYQYLAVPKLDKDAFLMAKVTGWEKLNLIDGPASIYFGNNYMGESQINTRLVEDTLDFSFGRDNQILVTRAKREDVSTKKLIGSNRTDALLYEIVVKNNRNMPITIEIQDQIPVSLRSDITVELNESSGAIPDAQTGKIKWVTQLNAGESVKYKLGFTVKYPKNMKLKLTVPRLTPRYM